jgi:hypothetical protein
MLTHVCSSAPPAFGQFAREKRGGCIDIKVPNLPTLDSMVKQLTGTSIYSPVFGNIISMHACTGRRMLWHPLNPHVRRHL